jgi:hypothetical protein
MRRIQQRTKPAGLLLTVLLLGAACGMVKNPFRDYSKKPFNSTEWRNADAIGRARMFHDLTDRHINGKSREEILNLLGEPDRKVSEDGREIWLYRVDFGHNSSMPYMPVTYDRKFGTFAGRLKDGKMGALSAE